MRLTVYTDYSLRVLIYLGTRTSRLATSREIAEYHGISNNHLLKVVHRLGALEYIETVRGKNGGIRLARALHEIVIGSVIREMEYDMALVQCKGAGAVPCRIEETCSLHPILDEALAAFLAVLDRHTLGDLVSSFAEMRAPLEPLPSLAAQTNADACDTCVIVTGTASGGEAMAS
ncbi:MAG: Rrf2 family transcriptional regulator nitric oxide-sensitive transcriptional repressor [Rhodospirillaceae bacterium]|nr:MAG: Rrf2 family transcriptional regulator nitric oxide-sensitive transcriptional repressor [Rhodospirillaceae bacterium]